MTSAVGSFTTYNLKSRIQNLKGALYLIYTQAEKEFLISRVCQDGTGFNLRDSDHIINDRKTSVAQHYPTCGNGDFVAHWQFRLLHILYKGDHNCRTDTARGRWRLEIGSQQ